VIRTPDQRLRVFVSSTLQELAAERAAAQEAIDRLHLAPVMFELGARPHPPRDLYRAYLEQSHVFVAIYWERYGWIAPDMDISGLEDEWRSAGSLPKLIYIKEPAPGREDRLNAMLDEIRDDSSMSYRRFSTPEELRELLENDLALMLSERFESVAAPDPDPAPVAPVLRSCLPRPPSPLIGRDVELATLRELLGRDDTRLVTITGVGGSGKTRLALEVAEELARDSQACFVDLSGLRTADMVLRTIAASVGVRDSGSRSLIEGIASVLDDRFLVLVIDNLEHVIDAAVELGDLLAATQRLKLLVTSRQALHLRWEHEFPLQPLQLPTTDTNGTDAIASAAAVDLFVDRARRVRPTFQLTDENAATIAEITRQLDGLPLALELAAARLRVLSPDDLLARLEHRLDALAASAPDAPVRHRTLREAISWSYELLSDEEQRVFRRLGVFGGGARLDAIEAVCTADDIDRAAVLDIVASLVDKSLLVSAADLGHSETRFFVLATVREFAVEQLLAAGDLVETFDRHLTWCAGLVARAWPEYWAHDMAVWLDRVEAEQDNLRIAFDHADGAGDPAVGLDMASVLWPFWDIRGHYREGEQLVRRALSRSPSTASAAYGRSLNAHGWLLALMGDFEQAMVLMEEGVSIVRGHGDALQLAWSLGEQGNVAFSLGRTEDADRLFSESLSLAVRHADAYLQGFALFGLAYVGLLRGDLDEMRSRLDQSLELTRYVIQPWGIAWGEFSLGVVSFMTGEIERAVVHVTESLEQRWSIRDTRGLTESLQVLASLASAVGDDEWSARLHGAAELQREASGLTILPFLRPMHDESVARLHAALEPASFDELWQAGRATPLEKVVREAAERAGVTNGDQLTEA
jgi:predicted ATPase